MSIVLAPAPPPLLTSPTSYSSSLVKRLICVPITSENVDVLKSLNSELFPVPYPEAYYATTMRPELSQFCMLIYLDGLAIAQVTCTLKPSECKAESKLYWMLMGVLPRYRQYGVGRFACQKVVNAVLEHNRRVNRLRTNTPDNSRIDFHDREVKKDVISTLSQYPISTMFLHVHVLNESARRLYGLFGFKEAKLLQNFYRRKGPEDTSIKDAWVLEKVVAVFD